MLRNTNFRTKLLGILAVPVLALVGLTAFTGYGRLADSRDASRLRHRIDVLAAATDLAHQVQLEQAVSAESVAVPGSHHDELVAQRTATDSAVTAYFAAVQRAGDIGSEKLDSGLDRVRRNLSALSTSYRGAVDLGSDINSVTFSYSEISASISDLIGTVADEASDPSLAREMSALAALSHAKDSTAKEWAVLDVSLSRGAFKDAEAGTFRGAVSERDRWMGIHDGLADQASRSALQTRLAGPAQTTTESIEASALASTEGYQSLTANPTQAITGDAIAWHDGMRTRVDVLHDVLASDTANIAAHAAAIEAAATRDLQTFLLVAAAAVLASVILGLVLGRTVSTPLRQLTGAAQQLADEQLPKLVNGLRNPGQDDDRFLSTTLTPIEVRGNDEIAQLARAFNTVQTVAVDVAAEQATLLRKGISEIFVNLARRNQVLIDRQIEFLDELEATEDDPDQLSQLYRLDHLATRMRRNAESLLVLAGMEPARTRTRPVALFDVVRAAIGEVEDFSRVDLDAFDDVDVTGNAAVDLGHLLAELMDNAAHFSPPDTRVSVEGRHGRAGYVITVVDRGIGMSEEQRAEANDLLVSPPPVGLALSRSLGFTVVARLAARYGVNVRLVAADGGGTSAIVHLPQHLVVSPNGDEEDTDGRVAAEDVDEHVAPAEVAEIDEPVADVPQPEVVPTLYDQARDADDEFESVVGAGWANERDDDPEQSFNDWLAEITAEVDDDVFAPRDHHEIGEPVVTHTEMPVDDAAADTGAGEQHDAVPATLRDALPQGPHFEQGLAELVHGGNPAGPGLIEPPVAVQDPPEPLALPALPRRATAPLPTPRADVVDDEVTASAEHGVEPAPVDDGTVTAAGLRRRVRRTDGELEGIERYRAAPSGPSIIATKRSPDDVRAMLARYRTGLQRGRAGDQPIEPEPGSA